MTTACVDISVMHARPKAVKLVTEQKEKEYFGTYMSPHELRQFGVTLTVEMPPTEPLDFAMFLQL